MNILVINHYAGSLEMGMEFRPYYLAREWIKMGHRVDIIAASFSHLRKKNPDVAKDFQECIIDGIHYHWIRTRHYNGNGVQRAIAMAQFVGKLWLHTVRIVRDMKPDVVIDSSTYPLDTYIGQKIRKKSKKKVKVIHEVHDMWPATLIEVGGMSKYHPFVIAMQIGENSAYKNSDYVVSLLPNAENYMREHGLKEGRFKCIPNGIILDEWMNPEKLPSEHAEVLNNLHKNGKFIIGYFGGHALSNNLDSIVDIASMIEDSTVQFVLVGNGVEKPKLMQRVIDDGLDNITFLPAINKKSIPKLCEYFDCIYMCGKNSPLYRFGLCLNKMFDTMAAGKPAICAIGVPSYFSKYHCGYDIANDNVIDACNMILHIKNLTKAQLQQLSQNGRSAVRDRFNYEILAQEFIEVMEDKK